MLEETDSRENKRADAEADEGRSVREGKLAGGAICPTVCMYVCMRICM